MQAQSHISQSFANITKNITTFLGFMEILYWNQNPKHHRRHRHTQRILEKNQKKNTLNKILELEVYFE